MHGFGHSLHNLGLNLTVVAIADNNKFARLTIEEIEKEADGAFLIVAVNRRDGSTLTRPVSTTRILPGDGIVVIERSGRAIT
jgi:voltage-gated potassium channel